jgi:hypothetical protein
VVNTPDGPTLPVVENTIGWLIALAHNTFPGTASRARRAGSGGPSCGAWTWPARRSGSLASGASGVAWQRYVRRPSGCASSRMTPTSTRTAAGSSASSGWIRWTRCSPWWTYYRCTARFCETVGLIGARELALLKPGAYLINTARGPVVVETRWLTRCASGGWPAPRWTSLSPSRCRRPSLRRSGQHHPLAAFCLVHQRGHLSHDDGLYRAGPDGVKRRMPAAPGQPGGVVASTALILVTTTCVHS